MFGTNKDTCWVCGVDFLTGCVLSGECPSCEEKRRTLETAKWKLKSNGLLGLEERTWEDPLFPGTVYPQSKALKLQESRDLERLQGGGRGI